MNPLLRLGYAPFLTQLVVTRRCNLSCGYCFEYDDHSAPVDFGLLCERLRRLRELGTWAIELTGGEPMVHPQIYELLAQARALGFYKRMMISNAYLFNAERVQRLNAAGLQELQISVDGVEPNTTTIKVLKPLRPKLEIVAREARFRVVLSAVLGSAPFSEVLEVVRYAKDHGFRPRVLVLHDADGQMCLEKRDLAQLAELEQLIGGRFNEARDYRSRLVREGQAPFKCRAGSRYLYVDEQGLVHWCAQTREQFGVPLERYSSDELQRQFHTAKTCNVGCTLGCVRSCSAYDEWRSQ